MSTLYKITEKEDYDSIILKINQLNSIDFEEFSGFRMGSFLAVSYYELLNNKLKPSFIQNIKNILRCFIKDYLYDFSQIKEGTVIVFYSHEHARRNDYVKLMSDIGNMIPDSTCFTGRDVKLRVKLRKECFRNLRLLKAWDTKLKSVEQDSRIRSFLVSKISLAFRWRSVLEKNIDILSKAKGLITIFDAREYENLLTQICSKHNIKTATIQHGYYPPSYFSDAENYYLGLPYLGFVSDEFWAWGDLSRKNAITSGLNKKQVFAVGYPKEIVNVGKERQIKKVIGVILDGGTACLESNLKMIRIGIEFAKYNQFSLLVKPHPHDFRNYIKLLAFDSTYPRINISYETIDLYSNNVCFSICFNSTAYIDLLCLNKQVFRYKDSDKRNIYDLLGNDDCFSNSIELKNLYGKFGNRVNCMTRLKLVGNIENVAACYAEKSKKLFHEE